MSPTTDQLTGITITLEVISIHGSEYRVTVEANEAGLTIDDLGLDDWYWDGEGCWLYPTQERRFVEQARATGATVVVKGNDPAGLGCTGEGMKNEQAQPDVQIENHGTVALVTPITPAAKQWVDENVAVESWQWLGQSFAAEPRSIPNLVAGMRNDGLTVE